MTTSTSSQVKTCMICILTSTDTYKVVGTAITDLKVYNHVTIKGFMCPTNNSLLTFIEIDNNNGLFVINHHEFCLKMALFSRKRGIYEILHEIYEKPWYLEYKGSHEDFHPRTSSFPRRCYGGRKQMSM